MQKLSLKLQRLQDKKLQSQRYMDGWAKRNEQLRITIEKSQAEMEDTGHKSKRNRWSKRSWTWKSEACRQETAEEVANASQSNGCCMDPAFWHKFLTSGADLVRQQLVLLQKRIRKHVWSEAPGSASHTGARAQRAISCGRRRR